MVIMAKLDCCLMLGSYPNLGLREDRPLSLSLSVRKDNLAHV